MGNLSENDRAFIFLMDYPNRRRIKIWGRAEVVEDDPQLLDRLVSPDYRARPERVFVVHIEAWDVNCPQHIKPRFTEEQVTEQIGPRVQALQERLDELEAEVDSLKSRTAE